MRRKGRLDTLSSASGLGYEVQQHRSLAVCMSHTLAEKHQFDLCHCEIRRFLGEISNREHSDERVKKTSAKISRVGRYIGEYQQPSSHGNFVVM